MNTQNIPTTDSPHHDAFEAIVELYYQSIGYITSTGKWFWVRDESKQQRGYQDIDILAINSKETVIVSATSNLDDKIRSDRSGAIREDMLENLLVYFRRTRSYLESTPEYQWLAGSQRNIKNVVAYINASTKTNEKTSALLINSGIEVISSTTIFGRLSEYSRTPNLKIQNQILRTIQISQPTHPGR